MKRCPQCYAPIQHETSEFIEFRCGAGLRRGAGVCPWSGNHWECDEATRAQRIEDNEGCKDDAERTDRKGVTA
jgi:hypothetical protein